MTYRVSMNAKTEHGIPYNEQLYAKNFEYETVVTDLDGLVEVRREIMTGGGMVSHYKIGSREITRGAMSASQILKLWDNLWDKKEKLEGVNGGRGRKSYGIVPRDNW